MQEYNLVISNTPEQLIQTVNEAIQQGYRPIGALVHIEGKLIQPIFIDVVKNIEKDVKDLKKEFNKHNTASTHYFNDKL